MKDQSKFAKKSLGQNFLTSTEVRDKILAEAGDLKGKKVLEIGPGLGFLTDPLLAAGADLTAVELDGRAVSLLTKKFGDKDNFNLIYGDILQQDLDSLFPPLVGAAGRGTNPDHTPSRSPYLGENTSDYCVIANIPYNITNPIIRKLLEKTANKPKFVLIMVQKEVAQKICDPQSSTNSKSSPLAGGSRRGASADESEVSKILSIPLQGQTAALPEVEKTAKRSILSIAVEVYAQAQYCFTVDREHFEPSPKVDSAIIRLDVLENPLITPKITRDFFTVVNAGFSEKRKKIGNVLGKFFGIPVKQLLGDIDGNRRAENLTIKEWLTVTDNFRKIET